MLSFSECLRFPYGELEGSEIALTYLGHKTMHNTDLMGAHRNGRIMSTAGLHVVGQMRREYSGACVSEGNWQSMAGFLVRDCLYLAPDNTVAAGFVWRHTNDERTFQESIDMTYFGGAEVIASLLDAAYGLEPN